MPDGTQPQLPGIYQLDCQTSDNFSAVEMFMILDKFLWDSESRNLDKKKQRHRIMQLLHFSSAIGRYLFCIFAYISNASWHWKVLHNYAW